MEAFGSKQTSEEYYVSFDFQNVMTAADTVASATVAASDSVGADATATVTDALKQTITGQIVYVWVKAGTSGQTYKITCTATTSDHSEIFELEAELPVQDI